MDTKVYYKVQVNKRINLGHRTYSDSTEEIKLFEEKDIKKAISLFKKRAHNDIIRVEVTVLDQMPYVNENIDFGHIETTYDTVNSTSHKTLVFKNQKVTFPL